MALVDREKLDAVNTAFDKAAQETLSQKMPGVWTAFTKRQNVNGTSVDVVYADTGAALREWFGARQKQGARVFRKNIELRKWQKDLELDIDDIQGDQTGVLGEMVAQFVEDKASDLEKVVVEELLSNPVGPDGVSLLNNSHPFVGGGGTVDNLETSALDASLLSTAMKKLRAMKNAAGQSLGTRPTALLVGPDQEEKALDLTADKKPVTVGESGEINAGSSGVGSTAIENNRSSFQVIVSGEITGNEWFLMDLSKRSKPMALYEFNGQGLRGDRFADPDDRNVILTNKATYHITGKISPAALDWRLIVGSVTS